MARENQGLQIALIIFVILTIGLAASTFLFVRWYQEANGRMQQALSDKQQSDNRESEVTAENNRLKQILGVPVTDTIQSIEDAFQQDVQKYGGAFAEDTRFYKPLLEQTAKALEERSAEKATALADLERERAERASKEKEILANVKVYQDTADAHNVDKESLRKKYDEDRTRILGTQEQLAQDLKQAQQQAQEAAGALETKLKGTEGELHKVEQRLATATEKLDEYTRDTIDMADGQVTYVNQREGKVWVNVGMADAVNLETNFAVYDEDVSNVAKAGKKASIEITRIMGDHLSEARVIEDDPRRPIMPGDKIDTPIWSPGEKRHFAITGFIDLDGDDRSDHELVREVIERHGGVVDAQTIPGNPQRQGEITVNTRYLVLGEAPGAREDQQISQSDADNFSRMLGDAERFRLQKISVEELMSRMGWKHRAPVVTYGRGANPADFRAKHPDDVVPTSTGNVFTPRTPPPGSAF